ncbi:hypothetical protein ACVWXM_009907 [Bradyrhizobium sp. GM7.3]
MSSASTRAIRLLCPSWQFFEGASGRLEAARGRAGDPTAATKNGPVGALTERWLSWGDEGVDQSPARPDQRCRRALLIRRPSLKFANCTTRSAMGLSEFRDMRQQRSMEAAELSAILRITSSTAGLHSGYREMETCRLGHKPPGNILVDEGVDILKISVVDRAIEYSRETPKAVLCHLDCLSDW